MGCGSCGSQENGIPKGCKNNGTCGADGCNKLTVFDWLSDMSDPLGMTLEKNIVEIRFKNSRKDFYWVPSTLQPSTGSIVVTEAQVGYDIGTVSLTGSLVYVQMHRKNISTTKELPAVLRMANEQEIQTWSSARDKEKEVQKRARELALTLGLKMKISDVEFQGDGRKAVFYYTAEGRVDFRQLIKDMAGAFNIRIEMKQIGLREEASRLGGIGSCGRELCCSTWLTDFRAVNTSAARYQQLALNPQKLAGQCGKLKCCLNFELDTYQDALKNFPKNDTKLNTEKGLAICQKSDIFQQVMWFAYKGDWSTWHKLNVEQVLEILSLNKKGESIESLEAYSSVLEPKKQLFENSVGQDSLTRFDQKNKKRSKKHSRKNSRPKKFNS